MKTYLSDGSQRGAVLIIGLILMIVATLLALSAMRGSTFQESITANLNNKASSFLAAETGATAAVEWLKENPSEWGKDPTVTVSDQSIEGGSKYSYQITYDSPLPDQAQIVADGEVTGTEARARIETIFSKAALAATPAAAVTCFGPKCIVSVGGSMAISGYDHDLPANFSCQGNQCKGSKIEAADGAIGVDIPDGGGTVSGDTSGKKEGKGIHGNPPVRNPSSSSPIDIGEHNGDYWKGKAADLTGSNGAVTVPSGGQTSNLGTRDAPAVTFLGDGAKINASVDGAGIIIVEAGATVTYNGNFHFEGLIILLPGAQLEGNGTATILGGIIGISENGAPIEIGKNGNFDIQYSTAALGNALGGEPGILSWTPVDPPAN